MEAPWPLVLVRNGHPIERPRPRRCREAAEQTGREAGHKGDGGNRGGRTPRVRQGPGCRPMAAKRGRTDAGNGGKHRHAAQGAETSGGGWRVAGVGEVQVDDVPRQERRWGAGV